jgi:hypothetical protein
VLVLPDEGKEQSIAAILSPRDASGRGRSSDSASPRLRWQSFSLVLRSGPQPVFGWVLVLLAGLAILWTSDASRGNRRSRIVVRSLVGLTVALIVAAHS